MCDVYDNGFKRLAKSYEQSYIKDSEGFLSEIAEFDSVRGCLVSLYCIFIRDGECVHIEKLPKSEKQNLWLEAKRISGMASTDKLIEVCKALYAFGTMMQLDAPPEAREFTHIRRER